jgi:hypothetical protein
LDQLSVCENQVVIKEFQKFRPPFAVPSLDVGGRKAMKMIDRNGSRAGHQEAGPDFWVLMVPARDPSLLLPIVQRCLMAQQRRRTTALPLALMKKPIAVPSTRLRCIFAGARGEETIVTDINNAVAGR